MDVLLNGQFTEEERDELSKELKLPVFEYVTKSIDPQEIVRILFRDFDAWTFLRDGILFSTISSTTKKTLSWVKKKKKNAKIQLAIEVLVKRNAESFSLNIFVPADDVDNFFLMLMTELNDDFIEGIQDKEILSIGKDDENVTRLKIIRMSR